MATVKLGTGIISIKGTFAGSVFRKSKSGQTIQSTPRSITRPPSTNQRTRRNAYRVCLNYIKSNYSNQLKQRWQAYAESHPRTNRSGEKITLTWMQAFFSINLVRAYNDIPIISAPPE